MSNAVVSPDIITIATNIGVFVAAAGTVIVAIWQAAKKVKAALPAEQSSTSVVGGMIVDHTAMLMWSETNRTVVDALREHEKELREFRFVMTRIMDKME